MSTVSLRETHSEVIKYQDSDTFFLVLALYQLNGFQMKQLLQGESVDFQL